MTNKHDHYVDDLLMNQEKILIATRQHWFVLIPSMLPDLFLILIIFAAVSQILVLWLPGWRIALGYLLLAIPGIDLFIDFIAWTNRKFYITNQRVFQLFGIYHKKIIDFSLEEIKDVKMKQSFFGHLLNFGDISLLSVHSSEGLQFYRIMNPVYLKNTVLYAIGNFNKNLAVH